VLVAKAVGVVSAVGAASVAVAGAVGGVSAVRLVALVAGAAVAAIDVAGVATATRDRGAVAGKLTVDIHALMNRINSVMTNPNRSFSMEKPRTTHSPMLIVLRIALLPLSTRDARWAWPGGKRGVFYHRI
jgi:hypothetical protein